MTSGPQLVTNGVPAPPVANGVPHPPLDVDPRGRRELDTEHGEPEPGVLSSPSQVSTVMDCSFKWYADKVLGLKRRQTGNLAVGKAVHAGILEGKMREKIYTHRDTPVTGVLAVYRDEWKKECDLTEFRKDEKHVELGHQGEILVAKYMAETAPMIDPAAVEEYASGVIGGVHVRAFIDLLDVDGRVIDLKTAAARPSSVEPMQKNQVTTYRILHPKATGGAIIQTLVKTKTPKIVNQPFMITAEDIRFAETIYPLARAVMQGEIFLPNRKSLMCSRRYCSFWRECEEQFGGEVPET
jgi:hypothetical protein